jgi:hypothetical protein
MENPRKYPENADLLLAEHEDSQRIYLKSPLSEGYTAIPATGITQAQNIAADGTQTNPEDWEPISKEEARSMF